MSVLINRNTWLEIDLDKFHHNLGQLTKDYQSEQIWAVMKSNAYGHGSRGLFLEFIAHEINHFCVGQIEEAIELQELADANNVEIEILIFGYCNYEHLGIVQKNWHISVGDVQWLEQIPQNLSKTIQIQLKINSGMNRNGITTIEQLRQCLAYIKNQEGIDCTGVYTHFATADCDEEYMQKQLQIFLQIIEGTEHLFKFIHAQNSWGSLVLPLEQRTLFNAIRPGGLCYGLTNKPTESYKPIMSLYSKIIAIQDIKMGDYVGYSNKFQAPSDGVIGVVPIGYADGWCRSNIGSTVYVNNQYAIIAGNICMEQMMLFIPNPAQLQIGDTVELIGEHISIYDVARHNQTIDYEIILLLNERIPRIYKGVKLWVD